MQAASSYRHAPLPPPAAAVLESTRMTGLASPATSPRPSDAAAAAAAVLFGFQNSRTKSEGFEKCTFEISVPGILINRQLQHAQTFGFF